MDETHMVLKGAIMDNNLYPSMKEVRRRIREAKQDDKPILGRLRQKGKRNSLVSSAQPSYTCKACGYIHNCRREVIKW